LETECTSIVKHWFLPELGEELQWNSNWQQTKIRLLWQQ